MRAAIFAATLAVTSVAQAEQLPRAGLLEQLEARQARAEKEFWEKAKAAAAAMHTQSVRLASEQQARLAADRDAQRDFDERVRSAERNAHWKTGAVLAGIGAGFGAGAGVFAALGAKREKAIGDGGFATAADIEAAASAGKAYNILSYVSGAVGATLLGIGVIIAIGGSTGSSSVAGVGPSGAYFSGSF